MTEEEKTETTETTPTTPATEQTEAPKEEKKELEAIAIKDEWRDMLKEAIKYRDMETEVNKSIVARVEELNKDETLKKLELEAKKWHRHAVTHMNLFWSKVSIELDDFRSFLYDEENDVIRVTEKEIGVKA